MHADYFNFQFVCFLYYVIYSNNIRNNYILYITIIYVNNSSSVFNNFCKC